MSSQKTSGEFKTLDNPVFGTIPNFLLNDDKLKFPETVLNDFLQSIFMIETFHHHGNSSPWMVAGIDGCEGAEGHIIRTLTVLSWAG